MLEEHEAHEKCGVDPRKRRKWHELYQVRPKESCRLDGLAKRTGKGRHFPRTKGVSCHGASVVYIRIHILFASDGQKNSNH